MKKSIKNLLCILFVLCLCFSLTSCLKSRTVEKVRSETVFYNEDGSLQFRGERYVCLPELPEYLAWHFSSGSEVVNAIPKQMPILLSAILGTWTTYCPGQNLLVSENGNAFCTEKDYAMLCDEIENATPNVYLYDYYGDDFFEEPEEKTVPVAVAALFDEARRGTPIDTETIWRSDYYPEFSADLCTESTLITCGHYMIVRTEEDIHGTPDDPNVVFPAGYYLEENLFNTETVYYRINPAGEVVIRDFLKTVN